MNTAFPLLEPIRNAWRMRGFPTSGKLILACSAGADSTALAALVGRLRNAGWSIRPRLAYVNHGWRSESEVQADVAHVRALGARLRMPVVISPPPPPPVRRTEAAARAYRYQFLTDLANGVDAVAVATGHHRLDQAETVLMRALRGSGAWGLAGMLPSRALGASTIKLIRPLLDADPGELREWLAKEGIPWRNDPSNTDVHFDRVRARQRLTAPGQRVTVDALNQLACSFQRKRQSLQTRVKRMVQNELRVYPWSQSLAIRRHVLRDMSIMECDCVMRMMCRTLIPGHNGPLFTQHQLAHVMAIIEHGGALDLPNGLVLSSHGSVVWVATRADSSLRLPTLQVCALTADSHNVAPASMPFGEALVDKQRITGALRVRLARRDDQFTPYSRSTRIRKVNVPAWLKSQGIARVGRRGQPVVIDVEDKIVWVIGHRIANTVAVGPTSQNVLHLRVEIPPLRMS